MIYNKTIFFIMILVSFVSFAQTLDKKDSIASIDTLKVKNNYQIQFKAKQLIN
jgi:hypothetical protein